MADSGIVTNYWAGTNNAVRKAAQAAFTYILKNLKIGPAEDQGIAGNMGGVWYQVTTSSVANREFSLAHQQNQTPTMVMPGMPLNVVGASVVPLEVSRAADDQRVYLTSSSTGASVYLYVEFGGL